MSQAMMGPRRCEVAVERLGHRCSQLAAWIAHKGTSTIAVCDSCREAIGGIQELAHVRFDAMKPSEGKTLVLLNHEGHDNETWREEAGPEGAD